MRQENPTVYSTETGRMCPKCGRVIADCICKKPMLPKNDGIVRIVRESKGRKGKTVTVIRGVPLAEEGLRSLLGDLKRMCGSGGSLKDGNLEIQGDHRDTVFEEIKKRGYTVKKVGG
jgi:translation initiation factor 1